MSPVNDQDAVKNLQILTDKIAALVAEGEQIFVKAGGQTVGQIEKVGETDHLNKIEGSAAELWCEALPFAAQVCHKTHKLYVMIEHAYAKDGIFSEDSVGARDVATSILEGKNKNGDYYPLGHLKGMVAALRYVLAKE